jgi:hypothetical protein
LRRARNETGDLVATRYTCGMMKQLKRVVLVLATLVVATGAHAEGTFDIPAGATFSQEKLAKIGAFFTKEIADKKFPARSF